MLHYLYLNYLVPHHDDFLFFDTKFTNPAMKYLELPMFIPLIAAIYLMTVYAVLKIAESHRRHESTSSKTNDNQQLEVNG